MAKSDLQFAGEFLITQCKLLTTSGNEYDIRNLVQNINIYEDIFSHTVSGDILLKDTINLVMNGPIIGQEKLLLRIQTPQASPKDETIINYVDTPLTVYKVNMVMGEGENALMYSLNFTTQESFRNQVCKISQSYKGQPSDIVEKILRDKNYLDSTRKLFVEETANHVKVVFPNMRPFMALVHLCKISNSKQYNQSPAYLFYETTKGFHFRSIDGLASQEATYDYEENIPNTLSKQGAIDPIKNLSTINDFTQSPTKDTIYNMNSGFYSSKLKVHDVYNKTLKDYDFSYLENFENDIHTEGTEPLMSKSTDAVSGKNLSEYPDTKLFVSTTSSGKHFYESKDYPYQSDNLINTMQRRISRFFQIDKGIKCQVKVPGQTTIQAGDIITLSVGATSSQTDDSIDKQVSGRHIITTLRHEFNLTGDPRHQMYMETIKDGLVDGFPENGVVYSNGGTSQKQIT